MKPTISCAETPERCTDLPEGWASGLMGDVANVVGGGTPATSDDRSFADDEGHPWITPADLSGREDMYICRGRRNLTEQGLHSCSAKLIPAGSVLMSSRAPIGYLAIAANKVCTNQGFKSFVCSEAVLPEYIYHWLKHMRPVVESMGSGSTFTEISGTRCKDIPLAVPPLAEQRRIVAKVEELLGRVNACRERLAKVPALLKRFRQSVLAAATSGRLTQDWREERPFDERKEVSQGRPLAEYDWREVSLPEGWTWGLLSEVADSKLGKMLDKDKNVGAPMPYLRNINVRWFAFDLGNLLEIRVREEERAKYSIHDGDVLVCEGGEPGRAAVWRGGKTSLLFQKALHRVRLRRFVSPDWLVYNLKFDADSPRLASLFTGSTIKHLTGKALAKYPLLIPPLLEQREIVRRVEALFRLTDTIEERVTAATARAEKLTRAILAKAFRGELVPTEAELARREGRDYETAEQLLAHVRAERQTGHENEGPGKARRTRHIRQEQRGPKNL